MKNLSQVLLTFLLASVVQAQPNTEVYLADLANNSVEQLINISSNPGYDNQPSFLPDGSGVLYASTRNGQTDVVLYDIESKTNTWLTDSEGSEYSPILMPNGTHFSTIILKPDGEQLLWKYPLKGGKPEVVVPNEVIGYHVWYNENMLFAFVLGDSVNPSTLVQFDLKNDNREIIASNIGRSLHKIPGSDEISFIDKTDPDKWIIKGYNPKTKSFRVITSTIQGSEDMHWKGKDSILMGTKYGLSIWNKGSGWSEPIVVFNTEGKVTRISLSSDGKSVALVF